MRPTYLPASFALGALTIGLRLGAANYTFAETVSVLCRQGRSDRCHRDVASPFWVCLDDVVVWEMQLLTTLEAEVAACNPDLHLTSFVFCLVLSPPFPSPPLICPAPSTAV